ncbi:MAG TPA: tripartite tricarboxylate transporter substrate-binding protein, partial [Burkholderiales bacterium]|nr:tripartite tricarboxylate transporter substrate-binding protein [Burkholderiales bacterium]
FRPCLISAPAIALVACPAPSVAQQYPTQAIRVVTSEATGGNDLISRLVAQGIAGPLGQSVTVDNRPAGVAPGEIVSKAPPDGHTILIYNNTLWVGPLMQPASYDAVKDFAPITEVARTPNVLVVASSSPVQSVGELIALARSRPGELKYGVSGIGAGGHLAGELFGSMAGIRIVPVPFKGARAALDALFANEMQLMFPTAISTGPHVKAGRMRALAVTSAQPSALMPDVAPLASFGLPGYESITIFAAFAPAATPRPVVARLHEEILHFLNGPGSREKIFGFGMEAVGSSAEELGAMVKAEIARMSKVIREAGIRVQ